MRIKCNGELIPDEWAEYYRYFGYEKGYYSPETVTSAISELEEGEELVLEINSVGGSVYDANEIYSAIKVCPNPTRAEIQSLGASAASYFPLACDKVEIALPAQMMIHCSSDGMVGNKDDHRWVADQLEVTDEAILDVYCSKCGDKADRDHLKELMEAETYLNARQCLELGLVDSIIGEPAETDTPPLGLTASITGNVIRAMRTLPDIAELKARREQEQTWKAACAEELRAEKEREWKG